MGSLRARVEGVEHRADVRGRRLFHAAIVAVFCAAAVPAQAASLCRAGEKTLFSCDFATTVIAFCGRPAGTVARTRTKAGKNGYARQLAAATEGYSGGGQTQISFGSVARRTIVYDKMVRTGFDPNGTNDAKVSTGMMIVKGDTMVSDQPCREKTRRGDVSPAAKGLPVTEIFDY